MINKLILVVFILLQMSALKALEINMSEGHEIFIQKCMACHGESGDGKLPGQPNFSKGDAFYKSDSVLIDVNREGKGVMPGFDGVLSEEEIRNVVAYIKTFL